MHDKSRCLFARQQSESVKQESRERGVTYLVVGVEQRLGNDDILLSGGGEDNDLSDILRSEGVAATGGRCQCPYNKVMI